MVKETSLCEETITPNSPALNRRNVKSMSAITDQRPLIDPENSVEYVIFVSFYIVP